MVKIEDLDKTKWVKASVLEEMLLDMKGYDNECWEASASVPELVVVKALDTDGPNANGTLKSRDTVASVMTSEPYVDTPGCDNGGPASIVIGLRGGSADPTLPNTSKDSSDSLESLISEQGIECWRTISLQVCIPLFFAGLGMVIAGYILDIVKDWNVFRSVPELLVMVTPLLGLKGNLEMTLASRLSTHSNLGNMDTLSKRWYLCSGNLVLIQIQANAVGFLTSLMAVGLGFALNGEFVLKNALLLCASSMLTASIASWVLGVLMTAVVILAKKFNINPDNIAVPIAGSFGDVTTLGLLACLASFLFQHMLTQTWLSPCIIFGCSLVQPIWIYIANKNTYTKDILRTGWLPVIVAMIFSCFGGVVLDLAEGLFPRMALFQPVINGVGGNLVSVQASRISTSLHKDCEPGTLPQRSEGTFNGGQIDKKENTVGIWLSPWSVFAKLGVHSVSARILLAIVVPGQAIFFVMSFLLSGDKDVSQLSIEFFVAYLLAAAIQVFILLYIAQILIHWLWVHKIDPDTSAIPYLTALGDLLGTGLLFLAFHILYSR